jgi:hypothetical protein
MLGGRHPKPTYLETETLCIMLPKVEIHLSVLHELSRGL